MQATCAVTNPGRHPERRKTDKASLAGKMHWPISASTDVGRGKGWEAFQVGGVWAEGVPKVGREKEVGLELLC